MQVERRELLPATLSSPFHAVAFVVACHIRRSLDRPRRGRIHRSPFGFVLSHDLSTASEDVLLAFA